jgi:hypothetical protein
LKSFLNWYSTPLVCSYHADNEPRVEAGFYYFLELGNGNVCFDGLHKDGFASDGVTVAGVRGMRLYLIAYSYLFFIEKCKTTHDAYIYYA